MTNSEPVSRNREQAMTNKAHLAASSPMRVWSGCADVKGGVVCGQIISSLSTPMTAAWCGTSSPALVYSRDDDWARR